MSKKSDSSSESSPLLSPSLARLTRGYRLLYLFAMLLATAATVLALGVPLIGKHALNVLVEQDFGFANDYLLLVGSWFGIPESYIPHLILSAVAGLILTMLAAACQFGRDRLSAVASESIAKRLRETLYRRLHFVPMKFYDGTETGDLVQRCSSDIETVRVFMHDDVDEAGRAILFVLGMIPILFWHHATLAACAFILIPILLFGAYFFFKSITKLFQVVDESEGALTAVIQENLTGIRVVRAFARSDYETDRFLERNAAFRDNYFNLNKLMALYWGVGDLIAMSQIGIVLFVGAHFYLAGSVNIGELFLFMMYVSTVVWRIRHAGRLLADGGKALVALRRINFVLDSEEESTETKPSRPRLRGNIEFKEVSISYSNDKPALSNVSATIQAGETIGLVGGAGSGKSTLLRALMRTRAISEGQILIDDLDISNINRQWLRESIGIVLQEPFLYSRSVRNNLLVGNAKASIEELQQVAKEAAIHDSIVGFRAGYDELVGERGVTLSGGQRQRVALARALLKNPPILILDDALSAVDSGTEELILGHLNERKGKHTTLIVAHRLSTLKSVDRIFVFQHGLLSQVGTHEELSKLPGPYYELCNLQALLDETIELETASNG